MSHEHAQPITPAKQTKRSNSLRAGCPGWFSVAPIYEGDDTPICELVRTPVIAWKIETITARDGSTFQATDAITIELSRDHECFQSPDGHFYLIEETDFATEQEVIAYFNRREEQRRKAERTGTEVDAR